MNENLTAEEKEDLVGKVTDLADRDVLKVGDYVQIISVCKEACERRVKEIDRQFGPEGPVQ